MKTDILKLSLWMAMAVAGGAIAACTPAAQQARPQTGGTIAPASTAPVAQAPTQGEPVPGIAGQGALAPTPAAAPTPEPDPDRLMGLNPADVIGLLGEPTFLRLDGPALMHRFESRAENADEPGNCVVEIYYYRAEIGGGFLARHLSVKRAGADFLGESCLADFFQTGAAPPQLLTRPEAEMPTGGAN